MKGYLEMKSLTIHDFMLFELKVLIYIFFLISYEICVLRCRAG